LIELRIRSVGRYDSSAFMKIRSAEAHSKKFSSWPLRKKPSALKCFHCGVAICTMYSPFLIVGCPTKGMVSRPPPPPPPPPGPSPRPRPHPPGPSPTDSTKQPAPTIQPPPHV